MASISVVFLVLSIAFVCGMAQPKQDSSISSSALLTYPGSWLSPSNRFAFGFYQQGSGFAVGIWLVSQDNRTVVWTANRDDPLVTSNAMVYFNRDGKLVLRTEQGQEQFIASSAKESVSYAAMLDSGNFVLYDTDNKAIWQSFENPTDTILGGQTVSSGSQLYSSLNKSDHSTGKFYLRMQPDGNLVLYPATSEDNPPDAYWVSDTYIPGGVHKNQLYLDFNGSLILINESTGATVLTLYSNFYGGINPNNNNNNTIYRATLDVDGIFRLYSHTYYENGSYHVSRLWSAPSNPCDVKGSCGFNSFCTQDNNQSDCRCLPGHDFVDPNRRTLGCERNFSRAGCRGAKENATFYYISTIKNMTWGDIPYFAAEMSMEECSSSCLEDCNCGAALFKNNNSCQKQQFPLKYVRRDTADGHMAFFKVGHTALLNPPLMITRKTEMVQIVLEIIGFTVLSCVALAIFGRFIFKMRVLRYNRLLHNGKLGLPEEVTLRLFTYNELRRVTKGFKEELGKGSFGAVYKDMMSLEKMVKVGLWCIQEEPALRPSMKCVVLMLEGYTIAVLNATVANPVLCNSSIEFEIKGLVTGTAKDAFVVSNYNHKGWRGSTSCSSPAKMNQNPLQETVFNYVS
ncbi:g-type lectin s-receptor-like serine/threonine-protein kinase lecrk3 [Quercus suber]|uniref:G-type lectin s-receptor-like serine/threonine-protein kinase lecrk3 n=1 Tax=Quercus suber TaxID=58331 RepID=A0AAW0MC34_QUESU